MPRTALCAKQPNRSCIMRPIRWAGWSIAGIFTVFATLWQGYIRTHLNDHRPQIEEALSRTLDLPVHIQTLDAGWDHLFPEIRMHGLCLDTPKHPCGIGAAALRVSLDWWFPWKTHRLDIDGPHVILQRERDGHLTLAGLLLHTENENDPTALFERLLDQHRIHIERGAFIWNDLTGRTRPLRLTDVNAHFENTWRHKYLHFKAQTSPTISDPIEGEFQFRSLGFHPRLSRLYGHGNISLPHLNLTAWAPYVSDISNPIHKGFADLNFAFDIHDGRLRYLDTQINIQHLEGLLNHQIIRLHQLQGHIMWSETGDEERGYRGTVTTQNLSLKTCPTCQSTPFNIETRLNYHHALHIEKAYTRIESLDLSSLSLLAQHIPLPRVWRAELQQHPIEGTLNHLEAYWNKLRSPFLPDRFSADVEHAGWHSSELHIPSVQELNAVIEGSPDAGTIFLLKNNHTSVHWPWLWTKFPEITKAEGQIHWSKNPYWKLSFNNIQLHTADGHITAEGTFAAPHSAQPGGWVQLKGSAELRQAPRLLAYLPLTLPPHLLNWLTMSLKAGNGTASWRIQGTPQHFPFVDGPDNEYIRFDIDAHQATLRFAEDWPMLTGIDGHILLHKNRIDIETQKARLGGLNIHPATASLTGIGTGAAQLSAQGHTSGSLAEALNILNQSPLRSHIPDFLNNASTSGQLNSSLTLHFPVANPASVQFESQNQIEAAYLPLPDLPALINAHGTLVLNDKGLVKSNMQASFSGEPIQLSLSPDSKQGFDLQAQGDLTPDSLSPWINASWRQFFKGRSHWDLTAYLGSTEHRYQFNSTLKGLASNLPAPLKKSADIDLPLSIEMEHKDNTPSIWWMKLPDAGIQVRWSPSDLPNRTSRGNIQLGYCRPQPSLPDNGWHISGQLDGTHVDFLNWWNQRPNLLPSTSTTSATSWQLPSVPLRIDLSLINTNALHPIFNNGILRWKSTQQHVQARFINHAISAQLHWNTHASAAQLHFDYLNLPVAPKTNTSTTTTRSSALHIQADRPPLGLPPLDIDINGLHYGTIHLGSVKMITQPKEDTLAIPLFQLTYNDNTLNTEGSWNTAGMMEWQGSWSFSDTGAFLKRLNLYEGLKKGSGTITGHLKWEGLTPLTNPTSLNGNITLDFKNGQFTQVDPGLAKLLGLSSLQAIPRRLALDFRDIFSEGFLFNQVSGRMNFEHARLQTDSPIKLDGDSAKLNIDGYTDLMRETQEFHVKVIPNLSTNVAAATAFFINPFVGGATFFAQKILQDPLEKAFSYKYLVTGTWDNPVIRSLDFNKPAELLNNKDSE